MFEVALVALLLTSPAHAESTASDPTRANIEIEQAYSDSSGGTFIIAAFQSPYGADAKPNPKFMQSNRTFYCKDGRCDQLSETGSSSGPDGLNLSFATGEGARGTLVADKKTGTYTSTCDGGSARSLKPVQVDRLKTMQNFIRQGQLVLNSLPDKRRTAFAFKNGSDYIYVDTSATNYSTDSYRVFFGPKGSMKQTEVKHVSVLRDGGTTTITLADGRTLYVPRSIGEPLPSKLDGVKIEKLSQEESEALAPKEKTTIAKNIVVPCDSKGPSSVSKPASNGGSRPKSAQ